MLIRTSTAIWKGGLRDGTGATQIGKGVFDGSYTFASRFESGTGTNPEELNVAAPAGCFSLALVLTLDQQGRTPESTTTTAQGKVDKVGDGFRIVGIDLSTEGVVPGIDEDGFRGKTEAAKKGCPVSVALSSVPITLEARLTTAKALGCAAHQIARAAGMHACRFFCGGCRAVNGG